MGIRSWRAGCVVNGEADDLWGLSSGEKESKRLSEIQPVDSSAS